MTAQPDWEHRFEELEDHVGLLDAQFQAIGQIAIKAKRTAEQAGPLLNEVVKYSKTIEEKVTAIEAKMATKDELAAFREETSARFEGIEGTLAEILRRLPPTE